ncbi:hypothetical protein N431DRAFT_432169 [Stipitochalara longipes BDJ]|nr:hypothetical protein N431DRAFT_432169 [Stipitochalara longipes BDJ]
MKVILTGVTGFIGSEVLSQCRQDPAITSIIALSRRPLPQSIRKDPKVEVIVMDDFTVYSPSVIERLEGADVCIWALGTTEARQDIEIDYPLAFCNAIAPAVARQGKTFRYIHTSGRLAERDQGKCLLFLSEGRRIKGKAELELMDFEANERTLHGGYWRTFIVKPSMVLPRKGDKGDLRWLGSVFIGSVDVDELAAAMVDIGRNGGEEQVSHNAEVVMRGRAVLDRKREGEERGSEKAAWSLW